MKTKILIIIVLLLTINFQALGLPKSFHTVVVPGNIQFQMSDSMGNITGYNPTTKSIIMNIPNTLYFLFDEPYEGTRTKDNSHYKLESQKYSNTIQMTPGMYKIKVFGTTTVENMNLYFNVFYQNIKGAQIMTEHASIIYPNVTWTYEITIPDVPPATKNVPLIKVANPQDLITDINAASSLGYIGNAKFVSELVKDINEIEAKKAKGKTDDGLTPAQKAKKEYAELLSEITEKYNKPESDEFVKKEAYDVLREDMEYIIEHL